MERLANDEQIDAALRLGILDRVLVISSQQGRTGDKTVEGVTVVRPESENAGADAARHRFDTILESDVLGPALTSFGFSPDGAPAYVLDIDLDTFSTRRGLTPADATVFHALIRHARMVTLAREPEYVQESLDDHTAAEIEASLLEHIERAMGA